MEENTSANQAQHVRKISAHAIYTPQGVLRGRVISIDGDGVIVGIESVESIDSMAGVEFYSGLLVAGMVNAHTHLELSYLRGSIPSGGGFARFAEQMSVQRERFSREERVKAADFFDAQMWAEGVSAVGDISNSATSFDVKRRSKIRYHSFLESYGLRSDSIDVTLELQGEANRCGLRSSITPHSTYSLNQGTFDLAVGDDDNAPLSIHFLESRGESELYKGRGEMKAWYDQSGFTTDFIPRYDSPTQRIIGCIPGNRRTLLVHNTHVMAGDVEQLQAHFGDNLTWVICPRSNQYISGEEPPVELLRRSGGRIAIGTDSLASNQSLSIIEELKMLGGVALEELLEMATLSGARALGVEAQLGSLEVGKSPGVVLIEGVDWSSMALTPQSTARRIV